MLLVYALPARKETPQQLLLSAVSLWVTNILVFALWYWRLDAGGPYQRDKQPGHSNGSFLFPQMTISKEALREGNSRTGRPILLIICSWLLIQAQPFHRPTCSCWRDGRKS